VQGSAFWITIDYFFVDFGLLNKNPAFALAHRKNKWFPQPLFIGSPPVEWILDPPKRGLANHKISGFLCRMFSVQKMYTLYFQLEKNCL
jgi:hypothetical protein